MSSAAWSVAAHLVTWNDCDEFLISVIIMDQLIKSYCTIINAHDKSYRKYLFTFGRNLNPE